MPVKASDLDQVVLTRHYISNGSNMKPGAIRTGHGPKNIAGLRRFAIRGLVRVEQIRHVGTI